MKEKDFNFLRKMVFFFDVVVVLVDFDFVLFSGLRLLRYMLVLFFDVRGVWCWESDL